MNYLTTLLTLATLLGTQAATSSLVGGVRVSTDTTGTNTIAATVVITNLNGGASRTALMARDAQVTNAVKVLSLTGNRVVGIGTDKALTNTTVSIAALEALSTAGTNNWINSGTTNSTLAGTAYPWAVEVTNHVNVGASGEAGIVLFSSTNGTYTASISLLSDGTLAVTNNGVLVATIALVSGNDGSTNKFLSAAGTYLTVSNNILPFYYISTNQVGLGSTNFFLGIYAGGASIGIGDNAGPNVGSNNGFIAVGPGSLQNTTGGQNSVAIGQNALHTTTASLQDVAIGVNALHDDTSGDDNVAVGYSAGSLLNGGVGDVLIGSDAQLGTVNDANSIVIGGGSVRGMGSNTANIGTNITALYINGTVGWFRGSGSPEGVVTATGGSFYSDESGYKLYVKETANGNTGWAVK